MWPELEQRTDAALQTIAEQLQVCPEFELVYPGMADTMDTADQAGRKVVCGRSSDKRTRQGLSITFRRMYQWSTDKWGIPANLTGKEDYAQ